MKKIHKVFIGVALSILAIVLFGIYQFGPMFNLYLFPPSPQKYAEIALAQMELGINSDSQEWKDFQKEALKQVKNSKSYEDNYDILAEAAKVAGGKHSFFVAADEIDHKVKDSDLPKIEKQDDYLILTVPEVGAGDNDGITQYANRLNDALQKQDYKGVVIDLRDNFGGDMGPMISGLSSLIPDGDLITFDMSKSSDSVVKLAEGKVMGGGSPVTLSHPGKVKPVPVAILMNEETASSAEITILAFKGLDNVRTFGKPTASYTSVNSTFDQYDKALLAITMGYLIDREGNKYENVPLQPDVETEDALNEALEWMKDQ